MSQYVTLTFCIGLLSQTLFSARLIVQWIASERARRIESPRIFWQLSLLASLLFCLYGWMRNDFAILLGQLVTYYIYIWNLRMKGAWHHIHPIMRCLIAGLPCVACGWFLFHWQTAFAHLFKQENLPTVLILFGTCSQLLFTLRFVYQWWYSSRHEASLLPVTFWCISLTGSLLIVIYAILRRDPVLILGQSCGFVVYARNIMIGLRHK